MLADLELQLTGGEIIIKDGKEIKTPEPSEAEKRLIADAFILTFKAPFANAKNAGEWYFANNSGFLAELNKIPKFKELGYKLAGGKNKSTILDFPQTVPLSSSE